MDRPISIDEFSEDGMFTVTRVKPVKDEDGQTQLMTCGCGCHGSVSVSNTTSGTDEPEILILQH